jgi:hypothetical protein
MYHHFEYCPKCNCVQNITFSISLKPIVQQNGIKEEILLCNYHCEVCNTYIKSVNFEEKYIAGYMPLNSMIPRFS